MKRGDLAEEDSGPLSAGSGRPQGEGGCFLDAAGGGEIAHRSEFSDRGSSAGDARRVVPDAGVREGAA